MTLGAVSVVVFCLADHSLCSPKSRPLLICHDYAFQKTTTALKIWPRIIIFQREESSEDFNEAQNSSNANRLSSEPK